MSLKSSLRSSARLLATLGGMIVAERVCASESLRVRRGLSIGEKVFL